MPDKNHHINQKPDGKYPEPGIPPVEAWLKMKEMLETEMPSTRRPLGIWAFMKSIWKPVLLAVFLSGLAYWVYQDAAAIFTRRNQIRQKTESQHRLPTDPGNTRQRETAVDPGKTKTTSTEGNEVKATTESDKVLARSQESGETNVSDATTIRTKKEQEKNKIGDSGNASGTNIGVGKRSAETSARPTALISDQITKNDILKKSKPPRKYFKGEQFQIVARKPISVQQQDRRLDEAQNTVLKNPEGLSASGLPYGISGEHTTTVQIQLLHNSGTHRSNNMLSGSFLALALLPGQRAVHTEITPASQTARPSKSNRRITDLHFGLQWMANTNGDFNDNFKQKNSRISPYLLAVPGIWASKQWAVRNTLMAHFNPYDFFYTGNGTLGNTFIPGPDSSKITRITSLKNIGSISSGLTYQRRLNDHWSAGAGINFRWNNRAVLQDRRTQGLRDKVLSDSISVSTIGKGNANWKYVNSNLLSARIEIAYRIRKLQFGAAAVVPFTGLSPLASIYKVNGQVFLRWTIR